MRATADHYAALGVSSCATTGDIRDAFRRLAKESHPDKNPNADATTRERFLRVVRAYEVLSDATRRSAYDKNAGIFRDDRPRPTTPESMADWIFDMLLAEHAPEALDMFASFLEKTGTTLLDLDLPEYLEYNDARDCEFLLAEALERHGRTAEALALYQLALDRESRRPHFRAFTQEVRTRVKRLHIRKLQEKIREERCPASLDDALEAVFRIGLTRRERAHCYKAVGAALEAADEFQLAREAVGKALRICPGLSGVKRLCERLDLDAQGAPIDTARTHSDPEAQHAG